MFGFRTPAKKTDTATDMNQPGSSKDIERAGPSPPTQAANVRKSIGEWETAKPSKTGPSTSPKKVTQAGLSKTTKTAIPLTPVETGTNVPPREATKYQDRISEAKACLTKAKLHLNNSRNLKTDIKIEVTQAVERLFQLVKEAENVKGTGKVKDNKEKDNKDKTENREVELGVENELIKKIEQHGKLLEENKMQMEKLRAAMEKQEEVRVTYASVAAGTVRRPPPMSTAMHSVVISSTKEEETGDEVMERIRTVVNAKEEGMRIDRIRKARDKKIIIGCRDQQEINRVTDKIKTAGKNFNIQEIKNKDPLVIMKGIFEYQTDEDILKALRNQNKNIFAGVSKENDRITIRYRKKTRNPHTTDVVATVSPQIWRNITEVGMVHIDIQQIRAADQSPLVQCSRCLGYGHGKRLCTESVDVCSHCGGPHLRMECTDWLTGGKPSCKNCKKAKMERLDHNTFSNECPIRNRWETLARSTVAYC